MKNACNLALLRSISLYLPLYQIQGWRVESEGGTTGRKVLYHVSAILIYESKRQSKTNHSKIDGIE